MRATVEDQLLSMRVEPEARQRIDLRLEEHGSDLLSAGRDEVKRFALLEAPA